MAVTLSHAYGSVLLVEEDAEIAARGKKFFLEWGNRVDVVSTPLAGYVRLAGCHGYNKVVIAARMMDPKRKDLKLLTMSPAEAIKKLWGLCL